MYSDKGTAIQKKCRYFNRGYCKYNIKYKYFHPKEICKDYLEHQKCDAKVCGKRHPRRCKWDQSKEGCQRNLSCAYLHVVKSNQEVGNVIIFILYAQLYTRNNNVVLIITESH